MKWLERAKAEFQKTAGRHPAKTAETGVLAVLAVPRQPNSQNTQGANAASEKRTGQPAFASSLRRAPLLPWQKKADWITHSGARLSAAAMASLISEVDGRNASGPSTEPRTDKQGVISFDDRQLQHLLREAEADLIGVHGWAEKDCASLFMLGISWMQVQPPSTASEIVAWALYDRAEREKQKNTVAVRCCDRCIHRAAAGAVTGRECLALRRHPRRHSRALVQEWLDAPNSSNQCSDFTKNRR